MLLQLNEKLALVKEQLRKKEKWGRKLEQCSADLHKEEERACSLLNQLKKEEKDVERLEGLSLHYLFQLILGKKDEQLKIEKQEALAAKLKYDEAKEAISALKQEINQIKQNLRIVHDSPEEYQRILKEKKLTLLGQPSIQSDKLYSLIEQSAYLKANLKELDEAILAGKALIGVLEKAKGSLEKAEGWGTWDMLGGGLISTAIKHGHIDDARQSIHTAQNHLRHFERELRDVNQHHNIEIEIGALLTFADYFFDGLIMDWVVQGRISESMAQVQEKYKQISTILNQLELEKNRVESEWHSVTKRQTEIIEQAD